jgi:predicted NBD/HSP70 family sugar kinase
MVLKFPLTSPRVVPPLDEDFLPAVLANHTFQTLADTSGEPLVIGLEREQGKISRYETRVLPETHPESAANLGYVERLVKFLLWQRGGYRILIGGPQKIGEHIRKIYSENGERQFDVHFMGAQVYEKPFSVSICQPSEIPSTDDSGAAIGRHLDGQRIGFDLGASDRKVSALIDGKVVFSEEKIWNPSAQADPGYHYNEIIDGLRTAAVKLEKIEAIGGSSAGIFIDNRPMVASLFRSIPKERLPEIHDIFLRVRREFNVPLVVINDGDVAALAGAMSLEDNGVLGIALGSSEAAGFVDRNGHILGWLNELSFAPVDFNPNAPADEWSNDIGCGSMYFSQQCVFRLAPKAGITIPDGIANAEKLAFVQNELENGREGARKIWQTMGVYMGYGIAHYADFYDVKNVILMGRCTSGLGGVIILEEALRVLRKEFPALLEKIHVQLPDEKSRRVGQSIAAASLPTIAW